MLESGANDYNSTMTVVAREGHKEIVKLMLESGANDYDYAIIAATEEGHEEIAELIRSYSQR
jgi:ankyrin repeat protein